MAVAAITETRQYLTFKLSNEVFAVDVAKVREILEYSSITRIPQTPEYMCGVINLRGCVVPVIDMRLKFNMHKTEPTVNTCIVVVEVVLGDELVVIGALADSVQEVFELEAEHIEPPPHIGTKFKTDFIMGMGKNNGQFLMILDIDKTFSGDELSLVEDLLDKGQDC